MLDRVQSVSFKGYIPVKYYAKHPNKDEYVPVLKKENIRKCNSYVVRNLNGTAKNMKDKGFVDFYKKYDRDYRQDPIVHSVYDRDSSLVYLVTGSDVDKVAEYARPVGIAKGEAKERTGKAKSFEATYAAREYIRNVMSFIASGCRRVKTCDGSNITMQVFFDPKYNKKDELTSFKFNHAKLVDERGRKSIYSCEKYKTEPDGQLSFLN